MAVKTGKMMNWTELADDLKRGVDRPAYILSGDEPFLIRQIERRIIKTLVPPGMEPVACVMISGEGKLSSDDTKQLVQEIVTPPFLSPEKVIVLRDSGFFASASTAVSGLSEQQQAVLTDMPERCHLIFTESSVHASNKLLKAMREHGAVAASIDRQAPRELLKWVSSLCARQSMRVTREAAESLILRCDDSMSDILHELETVFLHHRRSKAREITLEDIDFICREDQTGKIFDLTDAIAEGRTDKALQMLDVMLARKEAPIFIQTMLARQARDLLAAKECGTAASVMDSGLTKSAYFAGKLVRQARRFSFEKLEKMIEDCFRTDLAVKTGKLDGEEAVSLLVIRACEKG